MTAHQTTTTSAAQADAIGRLVSGKRRVSSGAVMCGALLSCFAGCADEPDDVDRDRVAQAASPDDVEAPARLPEELLLSNPKTIEEFSAAAERRSDFGGLWVEGEETGEPVIYIARTRKTLQPALRATDAKVVFVDARWSLARLDEELAKVRAADHLDDGVTFGAYVDPRINRVVVEPDLDAAEVLTDVAEIAARLGVDPAMLKVGEPIRMRTTIVGGSSSAGGATAGFPVTCPFYGGVIHGILTAGHASNGGYTSSTGCAFGGANWDAVTAGGVDRQIHFPATFGGCAPTRLLANGHWYSPETSWGYTGQSIRRYGRTTGSRLGTIYILNWYYNGVDGPWILSSTGLNCTGGDSGGPWYTTTGAHPLGITRGTTGSRCFASKIGYALYGTGCWVH